MEGPYGGNRDKYHFEGTTIPASPMVNHYPKLKPAINFGVDG